MRIHDAMRLRGRLRDVLGAKARALAGWLNTRTARMSTAVWKIVLLLFILAGSIIYTLVLTGKVFSSNIEPVSEWKQQLHIISSARPNGTMPVSVLRFERYIDSLQMTGCGRQIYDSILLQRPGLMDSLYRVKQLYAQ